jgi:hypothetical protein
MRTAASWGALLAHSSSLMWTEDGPEDAAVMDAVLVEAAMADAHAWVHSASRLWTCMGVCGFMAGVKLA